MRDVIAEGYDTDEIQEGIARVPGGETFNLQLVFDEKLSSADKNDALVYLQSNGVYPSKFYQDRNNVMHIQMTKPEGVAMPSLAILIGGTVLAGFVAWRLTTEGVLTSITNKIVPVALIGAAALVLMRLIDKKATNGR